MLLYIGNWLYESGDNRTNWEAVQLVNVRLAFFAFRNGFLER